MKKLLSFLLGAGIGSVVAYTVTKYFEPHKLEKGDKFKSYYNMLCMWLDSEENGKPVDLLLNKAGYETIAIYGMGNMGKRLYQKLKDTDVEVLYGIDSYVSNEVSGLNVLSIEDELPKVDAIVVTIPFAFEDIKNTMGKKVKCPILSLEHILFEV